jgi:hypothetical protein
MIMAGTCIEFDFLEGFPEPFTREIDHGSNEEMYLPIYTDGSVLCPYDDGKLVCVGHKENGSLKLAGFYCKNCGYLYDIFKGKEYKV